MLVYSERVTTRGVVEQDKEQDQSIVPFHNVEKRRGVSQTDTAVISADWPSENQGLENVAGTAHCAIA